MTHLTPLVGDVTGAGYLFGGDVVQQFNSSNAIELIARAQQDHLGMVDVEARP